ncbi:hypothetical protein V8E55_007204, partial [Tylopilus felleus]
VICEVISEKQETDCYQMLLQLIALTHTGQFFLQSSQEMFFVVTLCVSADMVVTHYI